MNCLYNNILDVIFKYKHQLEYIKVIQEIPRYKYKIMFNAVLFQMSEILKTYLMYYSIYNPRFERTCAVCNSTHKRHKKTLKCSNSNIWISMCNAKFKNGAFCYH